MTMLRALLLNFALPFVILAGGALFVAHPYGWLILDFCITAIVGSLCFIDEMVE